MNSRCINDPENKFDYCSLFGSSCFYKIISIDDGFQFADQKITNHNLTIGYLKRLAAVSFITLKNSLNGEGKTN